MSGRAIDIEIAGRQRTVKYSHNAVADAERAAGRVPVSRLMGDYAGFDSLRLLLWAGMKFNNKALKVEDAGDIIQEHYEQGGTQEDIINKLIIALRVAKILPEEEEIVPEETETEENDSQTEGNVHAGE